MPTRRTNQIIQFLIIKVISLMCMICHNEFVLKWISVLLNLLRHIINNVFISHPWRWGTFCRSVSTANQMKSKTQWQTAIQTPSRKFHSLVLLQLKNLKHIKCSREETWKHKTPREIPVNWKSINSNWLLTVNI